MESILNREVRRLRMKRQPTWDKYEVALLISTYMQIKNGKAEKTEALQQLSDKLYKC